MTFSTTSNVPIEFMPNIGKRTAKVLRSLGIDTIGQFTQLPEQLLIELFGPSIRSALVEPLVVPTIKPIITSKRALPFFKRFQLASQFMAML